MAIPCCFEHKALGLKLVVHGDDFTCTGRTAALDTYETELQKFFELKIKGRFGEQPGRTNEMRVLNRVVRLTKEGLLYEAEPRHTEILVRSLDVSGTTVVTPGDKAIAIEQDADVDHDLIMFKLKTFDDDGNPASAMKPTRYMSNSPAMLNELTRLCNRTHAHQQRAGGRAKPAEAYPLVLVLATLRGMNRTAKDMKSVNLSCQAGRDVIMQVAQYNSPTHSEERHAPMPPSSHPLQARGEMTTTFDPASVRQNYFAGYTCDPLPNHMVQEAVAEELAYFAKMVREATEIASAKQTMTSG